MRTNYRPTYLILLPRERRERERERERETEQTIYNHVYIYKKSLLQRAEK